MTFSIEQFFFGRNEKLKHKEEKIENLRARCKRLKKNNDEKSEKLADKRKSIRNLNRRCERLSGAINNKQEIVGRLRKRIEFLNDRLATMKGQESIHRVIRFSELCLSEKNTLKSDAYIAHGVQALPGATLLAEEVGGDAFCDVIEIPSFAKRAVMVPWPKSVISFQDEALANYLTKCKGLMTVGPTLGQHIHCYRAPVTVVQNYRYPEKLRRSMQLREWCNLKEDDRLILSISTTATGFEDVLKALQRFPDNVHLATLGKFFPQTYADEIDALVRELGLENRTHFFDQVPYDELTTIASGADIGLIVRDPAILNNHVSLPNRVFDYMFSGVGVVAPNIPDIIDILTERDFGYAIESLDEEGWYNGISKGLNRSEELAINAEKASKDMTWMSREAVLEKIFEDYKTITFFGLKDLVANNRTMRMALSLAQMGKHVRICTLSTLSEDPPVPAHENIEYYLIPRF